VTAPPRTIVVDGNDGTGKSTLVAHLRALGYAVQDRGFLTPLTDQADAAVDAACAAYAAQPSCAAIVLDAPVATSRARLAAAGKDLNERYHTKADLAHYRARFAAVAARVGASMVDAADNRDATRRRAHVALGLPPDGAGRVALPTGRLAATVQAVLFAHGVVLPVTGRAYHCRPSHADPHFVWLKPRSVPEAVALGLVEGGFVTTDVLAESLYRDDLAVVATVGALPDARIALVVPHDPADPAAPALVVPGRPLVIATEYPRIASAWAYARALPHVCVQTHGTTEAWVPLSADVAVDLVATGATLAANGLAVAETLIPRVDLAFVMSRTRRTAFHAHAFVRALSAHPKE